MLGFVRQWQSLETSSFVLFKVARNKVIDIELQSDLKSVFFK